MCIHVLERRGLTRTKSRYGELRVAEINVPQLSQWVPGAQEVRLLHRHLPLGLRSGLVRVYVAPSKASLLVGPLGTTAPSSSVQGHVQMDDMAQRRAMSSFPGVSAPRLRTTSLDRIVGYSVVLTAEMSRAYQVMRRP